MLRTAADGAGPVAVGAPSDTKAVVDVVRLDPEAALGLVAVYAVTDGYLPLGGAVLVCFSQVFGDVAVDRPEGDLVEAAFGRPLLLVLYSGCDKALETVTAVAVAGNFYYIFGVEVI